CYTAGTQPGNVDPARDVERAAAVAEEMGLELVTEEASLEEVEAALPTLADTIATTSPVKLGVALPEHVALQNAAEDIVLSGLGAEQVYAGYTRQREDELNRECLSGLRGLFHRDLYRDHAVAALAEKELRLPFLDHSLVEHALTVPGRHKVTDDYRKYVLRVAAEQLGVPEEAAWRTKTAAQYGSNFDKAIDRLAREHGFESKQAYCSSLRDLPDNRLGVLFSGGKDSNAALYRMQRRNNEIACLITLRSENDDSYMFDTKDGDVVRRQAQALDIPLLLQGTAGEKEDELDDLATALQRAKAEHGIDGVAAGALKSMYQKERVEQVAERAGLKTFAPLWNEDQAAYMRWLVREGFEVRITEVAAGGLGADWEGRILDADAVEELIGLAEEHGFQPAGEGGGFETVVEDAPTFN
ncbi:MAG: diphthine--ammonia ligase, partial [Candidatus Nanohaloarchaea archaeon]|nr:diphthine--ammonia ligase [Candidatus Nanohaloarchaea archaeon]